MQVYRVHDSIAKRDHFYSTLNDAKTAARDIANTTAAPSLVCTCELHDLKGKAMIMALLNRNSVFKQVDIVYRATPKKGLHAVAA